jgi:hypothetical protein
MMTDQWRGDTKNLASLGNSDYAFKTLRKAVYIIKKEKPELTICSASPVLWDLDGLSLESQAQQAEEIIARRKSIVENADAFVKTINDREWWGQG